ncbi:MAG: SAM-dependent methyltransferase [Sporichthyaceae bacterium]|nr:SAM-dependent methyltransferase [Sporichthyaceae bacterium]
MTDYLPWREAMAAALYGPGGFYRDPAGPAAHFRTSVHASALFAEALLQLAERERLRTVVDIGAGRGELLTALHELDPRLRLLGVEVAERPAELPEAISWRRTMPGGLTALVIANEWLDNVPIDVVEVDPHGVPRLVLVHPETGEEILGPEPTAEDVDWLQQWWPAAAGQRAEVGRGRDEAWAALVSGLGAGSLAVAIDYGHDLETRPAGGTLTGFRWGRQVAPIPDGSCDLTAHVAFDSVVAAARLAGATSIRLTTQRAALADLGLTGGRPALDRARTDPRSYVAELAHASEIGELRDPDGLGGFSWLMARR